MDNQDQGFKQPSLPEPPGFDFPQVEMPSPPPRPLVVEMPSIPPPPPMPQLADPPPGFSPPPPPSGFPPPPPPPPPQQVFQPSQGFPPPPPPPPGFQPPQGFTPPDQCCPPPLHFRTSSRPGAYPGKGLSTASMVLGIVSLVISLPSFGTLGITTAIIGLILGIIGRKNAKEAGALTGTATAGIILSIVGMVLSVIIIISIIAFIEQWDSYILEGFSQTFHKIRL